MCGSESPKKPPRWSTNKRLSLDYSLKNSSTGVFRQPVRLLVVLKELNVSLGDVKASGVAVYSRQSVLLYGKYLYGSESSEYIPFFL